MTVSEYIFDFLEKKGCKVVFMVSGSSAMWLTDALYRNENLNAICCQHEQVAAMSADGYGRVEKCPGVCLVTIGPGATNAITGVAEAYLDSTPMIVISGQANSKLLSYQNETKIRQTGTQSLSLDSMVSGITKYFATVMDEKDIQYHMEKAYTLAVSGRKGPVWLDIPIDIQNKQVPEQMQSFKSNETIKKVESLSEVVDLIEQSEKPLVIAGNGIVASDAKNELREFIDKYQIPIVTSRGGIEAIETDHPLFIGRPGSYGDRASHFAIQQCDLLLILGSRLSVSTIGYYPKKFAEKAKKIMVDIDTLELNKEDVPIDLKIQMDVKEFISQLLVEKIRTKSHDGWITFCRQNKKKYPVVQEKYREQDTINSYYLSESISDLAPEDAAIVVDTGSVCNIVSQSWKLKKNQHYIISGGLSCMGFFASSIGVASTNRKVIALAGDGSVQMNIQDLATIQYYNLPIKLFIYNNKGYMLIRHNQHNYMNDRFLGVGPDSGVPAVDFCKIANAYGIAAVKISTKEEMKEKIKYVLNLEGPVICEVMVEEFGIIAPKIASRVMPDGTLKAAEYDDLWPFLEKNSNIIQI